MLISKIRTDINGSDDENDNNGCSDDSWDDDGHIFEDKKLPSSIPNEDRSIPGIPFNPFVISSEMPSGEESMEIQNDNDDEMNALVDLLEDFGNQQMNAEALRKRIPSVEGDTEAEGEDGGEDGPEDGIETNAELENIAESEEPEDDQHHTNSDQPFKPVAPPRPSFKK